MGWDTRGWKGKVGWHSEGVFWGEVRILQMGEVQLNWCYEPGSCATAKAISWGMCKPTQAPTNPSHIIRYSIALGLRS